MVERALIGQRRAWRQDANSQIADSSWDNKLEWSDPNRPVRLAIIRYSDNREKLVAS